jgi:hypothetical protein
MQGAANHYRPQSLESRLFAYAYGGYFAGRRIFGTEGRYDIHTAHRLLQPMHDPIEIYERWVHRTHNIYHSQGPEIEFANSSFQLYCITTVVYNDAFKQKQQRERREHEAQIKSIASHHHQPKWFHVRSQTSWQQQARPEQQTIQGLRRSRTGQCY